MSTAAPHSWRFFRAGGVDQVRLDRPQDIAHLDQLDQKLWVSLSCPTKGLELDAAMLRILDSDGDGVVRPPEVLDAVRWLRSVLKDLSPIIAARDGVAIDNLRGDTDEGRRVLGAARLVLQGLGKGNAVQFTLADAERQSDALRQAPRNGDGVVPPAAIADEAARRLAQEIVDCLGGADDRSGNKGYDSALLNQFLDECRAFAAWQQEAQQDATLLPLGERTGAALAAIDAVAAKADDFFGRCRLAAYDARALAALNGEESAYLAVAAKDLTITAQEVAHLPLATIAAGKPMPLTGPVNPAWAAALATLRHDAVAPLLGKELTAISEAQWQELRGRFAPHRSWLGRSAGGRVAALGLARVREILAGKSVPLLQAAIDDDLSEGTSADAMADVEKVARLQRHFHELLENYVNFKRFYAREDAAFQAGRLYLDGRCCDLVLQVADPVKNASLSPMAKSCLVFADCTRPGGRKLSVVAAVTAGSSDNLFVGRNGVFYDRAGLDWNATVTKLIDNPISIRQAFWSPYKKLVRWIEEQVAKRAAAAEASSGTMLQGAASAAGTAATSGAAAAPPPPKKMDIGVLAAISVAISGVVGIVGALLDSFFNLGYLMPLGMLGVLVLISGPSMVIAWFKLRQRNLGPLLDANGWAINTLTRVNLPLGGALTERAALPKGAERSMRDPYAEKPSLWPRLVLVLLLLGGVAYGLFRFGYLYEWTGKEWLKPPAKQAAAQQGAQPATPPTQPATPPGEGEKK